MGDVMLAPTYPVARLTHRCDQCGRTIEVGEKYRRQGLVYDGRMSRVQCCLQCEAFARALYAAGFEGDEGSWAYLPDLDGGEVAYSGFSREFNLFRARWRENGALVDYPAPQPSNAHPEEKP